MSQAELLLDKICAACLRPAPDMTVSEWADEFRYLSPEAAAEHGKWTTIPFQREPLDALGDQKTYRIVVKSATQMLKTETILNGIGYFAHKDPGPMLVLQPRDADAKAFSKERIASIIRLCRRDPSIANCGWRFSLQEQQLLSIFHKTFILPSSFL